MEATARPRSRTRRPESQSRQRTATAQRALDRRNKRLARSVYRTTGAAVRNGGASTIPSSVVRGRSRAAITATMASSSRFRRRKMLRLSFVAGILIFCFVAFGVSLVLSSYVASQSETLVSLQANNRVLKERDAQLTKQLQESLSASQLAEKAAAMGMVPSGNVATLHKDGSTVKVIGTPMAAQGRTLQDINPPLPERKPLIVEEAKAAEPESEVQQVAFVKKKRPDTRAAVRSGP